jgi:hypothetical protein
MKPMKNPYLIVLIVVLSTLRCRENQKDSLLIPQKKFEFELVDGLGKVAIEFPKRTDTFFTWIQRSDCGRPCEHGDYRFQSKKNRIFKESGFYWVGEPEDSVEQLSIYHRRPDTLVRHNDSSIFKDRIHFRNNLLSDPETINIVCDTIIKIGERYFSIFKIEDFTKSKVYDRRLIAFTDISGNNLEFHYKLLTRSYDSVLTGFFERSLNNLKTVRLKDGG